MVIPATQESENSELDKSMIPKNTPKFFTLRDQRQAIFSSPSILNKRKPSTSLEKNLFQEKFKKIAESQSPAEISFKATRSVFGSDNEGENSTSSSHNNISDFNSTLDKFNDNKSRLQYVIGQLKRTKWVDSDATLKFTFNNLRLIF